jgi:hypothetical protein
MEEGYKPCPYCAEPIRIEARLCKHCNRKLSQPTPVWRWVLYGILGAAALSLFFYSLGRAPEADRQNQELVETMAKMRVPGVPDNKQGIARSHLEPAARTMSPGEIFEANSGSVVLLESYNEDNQLVATGSGFCVGDSIVATNYHVIRGATRLVARGKDSIKYEGSEVESFDPEHDLAIVKFSGLHLKPLPMADSRALKRGDHVTAIGAPLGIQNTLSDGIVTNLLSVGGVNVIQTSAPISQGSSGGPLFDDHGAVLGITAASNPRGELVNFAVSSLHLRQVLDHPAPVSFPDFLARTRVVVPVLRGSTTVPPGKARQYPFSVPPNQTFVIEGAFTISGGLANDVNWRLVQVLPSGQSVDVIPMARYSAQSALKRNLQTGNYVLILDNGFSLFFGRTITGEVSLTYFR